MTRTDEFNTEHFTPPGEQQAYIQIVGDASERAPLFAKLVKVNTAVKKLKQTGKYSAGNTKYDYATEADVIEPIAAALAKSGLATVPSVVEQWWHDLPGKYGTNRVCTVHAQLLIADSETGAYVVAHTYSTAANADKASNAAFTTAIKYLLAKLALVAFGDDADEYTVDGSKADGSKAPAPKAKQAPAAVKSVGKDVLDALMEEIANAEAGDRVKGLLKEKRWTWSKLTEEQVAAIRVKINEAEG